MFHMNFVQIAEFDWLPGRLKRFIYVKYSEVLFSKIIRRIKKEPCIHASDISLYIIY